MVMSTLLIFCAKLETIKPCSSTKESVFLLFFAKLVAKIALNLSI